MRIAPRPHPHSAAALGLAASLVWMLAGCGGRTEGPDEAVVVPEPGTSLKTGGSAAATGSPTPTAPAATTAGTEDPGTAAAVKAEGWGTLKGRILFGGTPPQSKVLVAKGATNAQNAEVCAAQTITSQYLVVDPDSKGVQYAMVYIPKPTAINEEARSAAGQAHVEFDQKNCVFIPHVLPVMKGATILVKSNDPVNHNVNSKLLNTKFNESLSPGVSREVIAKATERSPGAVVCDIHTWMKAWWMVIDSPYFAVTDAKGNFEIKNVPAGTQKVVAWHEASGNGGYITPSAGEAIVIKADGETTREFTIDPGKVRPES
jgi:plastocyanin